MKRVSPPPIQDKMFNASGALNPTWVLFFQKLFNETQRSSGDTEIMSAMISEGGDISASINEIIVRALFADSPKSYDGRIDAIERELQLASSARDRSRDIEDLNRAIAFSSSTPKPVYGWDDLRVPVNAVKVAATKVPTLTTYKGGHVYAFADQAVEGNEEQVTFVCQIPHGYKQGSSIYPHVHWVGQDNTEGNVRWKLTYSWANITEAFAAEADIYVDAANSTTTDTHNMASFSAISGVGKTISSMLICSLTRNSSHDNDTFTGKSAYLLEFDFHIEMDSVGSNTESKK